MHRLTFSYSLAKLIASYNEDYAIRQFSFRIGDKLEPGQTSRSGFYALMAKKGDYTLRISMMKEIAQLHSEDPSRYLAEAWLQMDDENVE